MRKYLQTILKPAVLAAALLPAACGYFKEDPMSHDALAKLDFACTQEQYPELPAEADILYRYALYHDLHNRKRPSQRKNVLDYLHYYRPPKLPPERPKQQQRKRLPLQDDTRQA